MQLSNLRNPCRSRLAGDGDLKDAIAGKPGSYKYLQSNESRASQPLAQRDELWVDEFPGRNKQTSPEML